MESQIKRDEIQETPLQSTTLQPWEGQPPIRRVPPLSTAPDGGREEKSPHAAAAKGFAQTFGLEIRAAMLMVIVDVMLFSGDLATLGALTPIGVGVAGVLGFIVYKMQVKWYGDDHDSALIKALVVGLLTAIPVPLTPIIAIPGGLIGIVKAVRRK
jgi:hypothetical protein